MIVRKFVKIGKWLLSVQASSFHYCSPRVDGLAISKYASVEVGILNAETDELAQPRRINNFPPPLAELFEDGEAPVAGYVAQTDVCKIRAALQALADSDEAAKEFKNFSNNPMQSLIFIRINRDPLSRAIMSGDGIPVNVIARLAGEEFEVNQIVGGACKIYERGADGLAVGAGWWLASGVYEII